MRQAAIKMYWILTIISQASLIIVLFRHAPYENTYDILLIVVGIVFTLFSWLPVLPIYNIMKTNDEIQDAFRKAEQSEQKWGKAFDILEGIALEKMGVTVDEIAKRMKGNKDK